MPTLGVNVAVVRNDQILLTRREDFEVWCLPGGTIEPGESLAQAAVRETYEETGLEIELSRLVGVYSRLGFLGDSHVALFAAVPVGGELRTQPGETIELGWFAGDTIPVDTIEWYHQRIADALNGVGGGVAWLQYMGSPLGETVETRQEIYNLRDRSGLSRQEFYLQSVEKMKPEDQILEVDGL